MDYLVQSCQHTSSVFIKEGMRIQHQWLNATLGMRRWNKIVAVNEERWNQKSTPNGTFTDGNSTRTSIRQQRHFSVASGTLWPMKSFFALCVFRYPVPHSNTICLFSGTLWLRRASLCPAFVSTQSHTPDCQPYGVCSVDLFGLWKNFCVHLSVSLLSSPTLLTLIYIVGTITMWKWIGAYWLLRAAVNISHS